MKSLIRRVILLITLASTVGIIPNQLFATHLVGADINYTCLGGNSYRIDLTFYRDCRGSLPPLGVGIEFRSASCNQYFTDTIVSVPNTGQEITYPCISTVTSCDNPSSNSPGIQQYRYSGVVTLPAQCDDWIISWKYCCRNCNITTMVQSQPCIEGSNPGMCVSATLDNLNFNCNSSPRFTNIPVAFVCIGQRFVYNHGVIDPDGDSLVYSLVNPAVDTAGNSIPFVPGYSATNPISSSPALTIDPSTGDLIMTPTQPEIGILAVLVQEYRNGILIGSSVRDMQVYAQQCNNQLPTASGINGTNVRDTTVCPGTSLCFDITTNDADAGQIVSMTWNSGIPAATFNVSGFPFPTGRFCWTPQSSDIRQAPYTFTVTVRDDACPNSGTQTYSFRVFVNSPLVNINVSDIICNGNSNGSISVTPVNQGGYSFLWSPGGSTSSSISNLSPGSYNVTVYDSTTGCQGTFTRVISNPPVLNVTATSNNLPCGGSNGTATATATGGGGSYSYSWNSNPVQTTVTATGLATGTYVVTVTDNRGCSKTASVNVNNTGSAITVNATGSNLNCFTDNNGTATATATGGNGGYTYVWNTIPQQNGQTATGLSVGTYIVTVTDQAGCSNTQSVAVTSPPQINVTPTILPASCNASDGSINISVSGGTGAYAYSWVGYPNATTSLSNLAAGVYNLTITDGNNCSYNQSFAVGSNSVIPSVTPNSPSCNGISDGYAVVTASGGTGPYTYVWQTNPVQTNDTAFNLPAGTYGVLVTDAVNCTAAATVVITQPQPLVVGITPDNSCVTAPTGNPQALVTGGTPTYTYNWSPSGGSAAIANDVGPGTYTVTVTDQSGCTATQTTTVNQLADITVSLDSTVTPICNGGFDGAIYIDASGGTGTLTYLWSPGNAISQDLTGVDGGLYNVVVTDNNGCTRSLSATVIDPLPVPINQGPDTAICAGNSIQLSAQLAPGTTGIWSSALGITFSSNTNPNAIASNIPAGFSAVTWTVTDINGCSSVGSVNLFNYVNLSSNAGNDTLYCGTTGLQLNGLIYPGFTGVWSSTTGVTFDDPTLPNAIAQFTQQGNSNVIWTITNGLCSALDTAIVNYDGSCELELPTGFSPNGDGFNDGYYIRGLFKYPINNFRVFNRWGNLVYEKEDYMNTDWVGQNKNGEDLPEGTYFVVFEVKNSSLVKNTYVDLRRTINK